MNRILIAVAVLFLTSSLHAQQSLKVDARGFKQTPFSSTNMSSSPDDFQFAIISDRTGGHRDGVFEKGIEKINLIHPDLIMSVGDLIEGYTNDQKEIEAQWDEMDNMIAKANSPFFYVAGNHDYSNPKMKNLWTQRLGADYYSFKYKDVLFLCLNSEEVFSELGNGSIGKEQYEYFSNVLDKNKDAKWVFTFMHQPLWRHNKTDHWKKLEDKLANFKHTVFAGHIHNYTAYRVNNSKYITLGTTGGGSQLRGKAFGEEDHFTLVKFVDGEPIIANLSLNGVDDWDYVTEESDAIFSGFNQNPPLYIKPQYKTDAYQLNQIELVFNNTSDYEFNAEIVALAHPKITIKTTTVSETIPANSKKIVTIPVEVKDNSYYQNMNPIVLQANCKFNGMGRTASSWKQEVVFQPQQQFKMKLNDKKIAVDGDISEWENLPFEIKDENGISPVTAKFGVVDQGDFIYFGVDVTDPTIDYSGGNDLASAESFMFQLDFNDKEISSFNTGDNGGLLRREWTVLATPITAETGEIVYKIILPKTADGKYKLTKKGYQVEFQFPKNEIAAKQKNANWNNIRINARIVDRANGHASPINWNKPWKDAVFGTGIFERNSIAGKLEKEAASLANVLKKENSCSNPFQVEFPENCTDLGINHVLEGADNFRNITVPRTSKIQLQEGKLFRADGLYKLTRDDVQYLESLNLKTVIDFRANIAEEPDAQIKTVKNWMNPVIEEDGGGFMSNFDEVTGKMVGKWFYDGNFHKIDSVLKAKKIDYVAQKKANYAKLPDFTKEYSVFMKTLADETNYPIVFHCQGGATRTGFASAMVMKLLGFSDEEIYNDFLTTNVYAVRAMKKLFPADLTHLAKSFSVFREHLEASFATIETEYGGFDNYLRKDLNLTDSEIENIKTILLSN